MNKMEVIFGAIEILIGIILFCKSQTFSSFLFMLGGYHIGKGLYEGGK